MLVATITDGKRTEHMHRHGHIAPMCLTGYKNVCGYWESRFELFLWACEALGMDPYRAEWIVPETLEVLSYEDLEAEYYDMLEETED